jgi:stringent starvation protein B
VPVTHVIAIYARENGQGMAFPAPTAENALEPGPQPRQAGTGGTHLVLAEGTAKPDAAAEPSEPPPEPPAPGRPALKRVK